MENNNLEYSYNKIIALSNAINSMKDVFIHDLKVKDAIVKIASEKLLEELKKI
jgi:hypothetical protein